MLLDHMDARFSLFKVGIVPEETKPCRDCGMLTDKHHNRIPMCESCESQNWTNAKIHDLAVEYGDEHRCSDWDDNESGLCGYCGEVIPESLSVGMLKAEEPSEDEIREYESRQGEN